MRYRAVRGPVAAPGAARDVVAVDPQWPARAAPADLVLPLMGVIMCGFDEQRTGRRQGAVHGPDGAALAVAGNFRRCASGFSDWPLWPVPNAAMPDRLCPETGTRLLSLPDWTAGNHHLRMTVALSSGRQFRPIHLLSFNAEGPGWRSCSATRIGCYPASRRHLSAESASAAPEHQASFRRGAPPCLRKEWDA